jgi:aminoglycoside 6-adenylyltransferase
VNDNKVVSFMQRETGVKIKMFHEFVNILRLVDYCRKLFPDEVKSNSMRSEKEMFGLILKTARKDERVRAVILNGSRANPKAKKDIFQDYDIVYLVTELETFTRNHNWIEVFGERLILQMPEQMKLPGEELSSRDTFAYLMIFKDGNRIDLTLFPVEKLKSPFVLDSLSVLLLDKDRLFTDFPTSNDSDYLIRKPLEKEFTDVCNEFWWVSTYVAKGLWRSQITYAKEMLETIVRKMFMKIIEWQIGIRTDFSANFGSGGKNLKHFVTAEFYDKILATYPDAGVESIWASLFLMADIFNESSGFIADHFGFPYQKAESLKVTEYLKKVKLLSEPGTH